MTEQERLSAVDEWAQSQPNLPQHLWSPERYRVEAYMQQERQIHFVSEGK